MIRLKELYYGSKLSGGSTIFSLVFHTEGLINERVVRSLEEFGRGLRDKFRPLLAVITPHCPQYSIDPFRDPLRTRFAREGLPEPAMAKFEATIKSLASYYDVGYHGHFFRAEGGQYQPSFDPKTISAQFHQEVDYLAGMGLRPRAYAGGWWHISRDLVSMLQKTGFSVDTTINDLGRDSFSRRQEIKAPLPGRPFWIGDGLLEVPSTRSVRTLITTATRSRKSPKFVVLALHDFDLRLDPESKEMIDIVERLRNAERIVSIDNLVAQAKKWLDSYVPEITHGSGTS